MRNDKNVDLDVGLVLEIIDNCQELHTLPRLGGLLAQDALFMYLYNQVRSFRDLRAQLDSNKSKSKAGV